MIRVLVADDSQALRRFVTRVLEATERITVCGAVEDGRGVVETMARHSADVLVLDMQMPRIDGLAVTRDVMARRPRPIVIFCGTTMPALQLRAFEALAAGAFALVEKPSGTREPALAAADLVRNVEAAAASIGAVARGGASEPVGRERPRVLALGASTGGPAALRLFLRCLGPAVSVPILVVQHITAGFIPTFVSWLASEVPQPVVVAQPGPMRCGEVHIAPTDGHLIVKAGSISVDRSTAAINGHRPSVDALFLSVADELGGAGAGVLLTGMGADGAAGLLAIRRAGGHTFAQDEASCVVFGMPRAALALGAAQESGGAERLATAVRRRLDA